MNPKKELLWSLWVSQQVNLTRGGRGMRIINRQEAALSLFNLPIGP